MAAVPHSTSKHIPYVPQPPPDVVCKEHDPLYVSQTMPHIPHRPTTLPKPCMAAAPTVNCHTPSSPRNAHLIICNPRVSKQSSQYHTEDSSRYVWGFFFITYILCFRPGLTAIQGSAFSPTSRPFFLPNLIHHMPQFYAA